MDELDQIFESAHANAVAPVFNSGTIDLDKIFENAHAANAAAQGNQESLNPLSAQVGKGLTFGLFDEFQGVDKGLQGLFADLFGRGNGKSFSENYQAGTDAARAQDKTYETEHPGRAIAAQLAGGLLPAVATGGGSLLASGGTRAATGVTGALARNLYGVGLEGAPTLTQLAKMGAAGGALAGAGEGEDLTDRAKKAALGGAVGTALAPILGKSVETGTSAIADIFARNRGAQIGAAVGERGSFSNNPIEAFSPEELMLAKQLRNAPVDKIRAGATDLETALSSDVPLFLPEALRSPKVDRNARFIANYEPSMDFAQSAIDARTAGAADRATSLFDAVSPEQNSFEGAARMIKSAGEIFQSAEKARADTAAPLYRQAYDEVPEISSPALTELLDKDKIFSQAVANVKKTANNADLPVTSSELLVKARSEIGNLIDTAQSQGLGRKARDLTDTYNRLNSILHTENPTLAAADSTYASASSEIENLGGTFLKNLSSLSADKVDNIGQVFKLPAERIGQLRAKFAEAGKIDDWNAGIRSYMQSTVEGTRDGSNFTNKLTGNTLQDKKLQAALGDSYDSVAKGLGYEDRMFVGKNKYNAGSTTAGNFEEKQSLQKDIGVIRSAIGGKFGPLIDKLFPNDIPADVAQGLAEIYFDPKLGKSVIEKVLPLLDQYAKNQQIASAVGKGVATESTRGYPIFDEYRSGRPPGSSQASSDLGPSYPRPSSTTQKTQPQEGERSLARENQNSSSFESAPTPNATQDSDLDRLANDLYGKKKGENVMDSVFKKTSMQAPQESATAQLVKAVIGQESGGNPKAESQQNDYMKANNTGSAKGLMQLLDSTGRYWHNKLGIEEPYDPYNKEQNVKIGSAYLNHLLDMFDGDKELALTAYHSGEGKVQSLVRNNLNEGGSGTLEEILSGLGPVGRKYAKQVLARLPQDTNRSEMI